MTGDATPDGPAGATRDIDGGEMSPLEQMSVRMSKVMQRMPHLLAAEFDLSLPRLNALSVLLGCPASQVQLAAALQSSPSATSRLVSAMERDALVARTRGRDQRVQMVTLTDAGSQLAQQVQHRTRQLVDEVAVRAGREHVDRTSRELSALLDVLLDVIDAAERDL